MKRITAPLAYLIVVLWVAPIAMAGLENPGLTITASNSDGTATKVVPLGDFSYDAGYGEWSLFWFSPVNLMDGSKLIARVDNLSMFVVDNPLNEISITLQYTFIAGPAASDTDFTIVPDMASFPVIPAAEARANMSDTFVITELNNDTDNVVWLSALNNFAYKTYYGYDDGSLTETEFGYSTSVGTIGGIGEGATYNAFDNVPLFGYSDLGVPVNRARVETAFSLTRLDKAQVSHAFTIVPEPGPLSVMALVAVGLFARRR